MDCEGGLLFGIERELTARGFAEGRTICYFRETDSTNDDAAKMATQGAAAGSIIIAESQRKGRGRLGKKWLSRPGTALTFSYIARPALATEEMPRLTLVAGLAVANAIQEQTGLLTAIKWPNDILIEGGKVAGLLCEFHSGAGMAEEAAVIIGIGVNISSGLKDFPSELRQRATSLVLAGAKDPSPAELLLSIIRHLEELVQRMLTEGFGPILEEWKEKDATKGKKLAWLDVGGRIVEGVSLGPGDDGVLRISLGSGRVVQVLSGDLSLAENE